MTLITEEFYCDGMVRLSTISPRSHTSILYHSCTFWLEAVLSVWTTQLKHNQPSVGKGNYLETDWQHTLASPDSSIKSDAAVTTPGTTVTTAEG